MKFDQEKNRWDLVPFEQLDKVVEAYTHGAKKYAPHNWKNFPSDEGREKYFAALMRHVSEYRAGQKIDPKTGLHHMAQVVFNALTMMWFDDNEVQEIPDTILRAANKLRTATSKTPTAKKVTKKKVVRKKKRVRAR